MSVLTNAVQNPTAALNLTGITIYGTGTTNARVVDTDGSTYILSTRGTGVNFGAAFTCALAGFAAGARVTCSADVWVPSATSVDFVGFLVNAAIGQIVVEPGQLANANALVPIANVPRDQWVRIYCTGALAADLTSFRVRGNNGPTPVVTGDTLRIRNVMLNLGGPEGYFSGDTPDTARLDYAWTGTANNSASTRTDRSALPVVRVLLDDGSDTWAYDISGSVDLEGSNIQINRGREDNFSEIDASTCALTLDNTSGRFTPGRPTTNIAPNPRAAVNASFWAVVGGATSARDTTRYLVGPASMQVTWPTALAGVADIRQTPSTHDIGTTYYASAYVWVPSGTPPVHLKGPGSTPGSTSASSTLFDQWERLSISYPATGASHAIRLLSDGDTTAGQSVNITMLLVEPGGLYPYIEPQLLDVDTPARVQVRKPDGSWSDRFTGNVYQWPVVWPGGNRYSQVTISGNDKMARLARGKLSPGFRAELLRDGPVGLWPLDDPDGSQKAANLTRATPAPPLLLGGPRTPGVAFGVPGLLADTTAAAVSATGTQDGQFLEVIPAAPWGSSGAVTLEVWFQTTATSEQYILSAHGSGGTYADWHAPELILDIGSSRLALVTMPGIAYFASPGPLNDGEWHHVAVSYTTTGGADTAKAYYDGVLGRTVTGDPFQPLTRFRLGADQGADVNGTASQTSTDMSLAYAAVFEGALTDARIADHAAALRNFAGELSSARVRRLAEQAGIPSSSIVTETGQQAVAGQDTANVAPLDAMHEVERAELGLLFVNGSGQLVFHSRAHRYTTTPALTLDGHDVGVDTTMVLDNQELENYAEASRAAASETDEPATIVVQDVASVTKRGQYPVRSDVSGLLVPTDLEAQAVAEWRVNTHAVPQVRISQASIDLLTQSSPMLTAVLGLELGGLLHLSGLPEQAPGTTADLFVEGWEERIGFEEWSLQVNTSTRYDVWVIEDPVYGAVDSTHRVAL